MTLHQVLITIRIDYSVCGIFWYVAVAILLWIKHSCAVTLVWVDKKWRTWWCAGGLIRWGCLSQSSKQPDHPLKVSSSKQFLQQRSFQYTEYILHPITLDLQYCPIEFLNALQKSQERFDFSLTEGNYRYCSIIYQNGIKASWVTTQCHL